MMRRSPYFTANCVTIGVLIGLVVALSVNSLRNSDFWPLVLPQFGGLSGVIVSFVILRTTVWNQ